MPLVLNSPPTYGKKELNRATHTYRQTLIPCLIVVKKELWENDGQLKIVF